jgi:ribose transport system substrate-binding protein
MRRAASARRLVAFMILGGVAGCSGGDGQQPGASAVGASQSAKKDASAASGGVAFVGFDASPPLVAALEAGELQGLVLQNPYRMGETGVRTLVDALEKKRVEAKISTGEEMATPENRTDPKIAALLDPPKEEHSSESGLTGAKQKKWRVMVIPKGTTHEFWKTIHAGAKKAATELGNVEIIWQGPLKEDDRTEQIKLVQNAVAAKVDGIVLAPLDAKALVGPVEAAVKAGIPVLIFDSALESTNIVSYVATDNYHGGVLGAQRLGSLLGGKGRIILLRYAAGSESTEQREKGFIDTMKKEFPGITFVSDSQYAGATSDSAQKISQNLVTRFRGQVDGIFCPNESSTAGMLRALRDAGMLKRRP